MPKTKMTPVRPFPNAGRRPVRPIDREKMVSWLRRQLDEAQMPGVGYVDKDKNIFEIPWKHAAIRNYSCKDGEIFERWAIHTKKYIVGRDKVKDPKRWKANFRCALNSLPDVERIKGTTSKGSAAVRRYRFLSPEEAKSKSNNICGKARRKRSSESSEDTDSDELEDEQPKFQETRQRYKQQQPLSVESLHEDPVPEDAISPASIPNFAKLFEDGDSSITCHTSRAHMSGCSVLNLKAGNMPSSPDSQPRSDSPSSMGGRSELSDEEVLEFVVSLETSEFGLDKYHPKLWSEDMIPMEGVAAEVVLGGDEVMDITGSESGLVNMDSGAVLWQDQSPSSDCSAD